MSARRSSQTTGRSNNKVSREAEREGRFQDVIDVLRAMMAEDADRNEEQGRKTLLKAHRSAKEVRHWGEIAKCWFHYFYDIEQTKECFFKAVEIAGDSLMVATVEFRIKEVDDEGRVVRHVIGHRMVPTRVYLHSLFAATLCLRGETDRQAEFMGRAEEAADNLKSSMHAFDQFDEETLLYFDRAESQLGWLHIARCWREDFDERQQALRCIAKAEELAKVMSTTTNWVEGGQVLDENHWGTQGSAPLRGGG